MRARSYRWILAGGAAALLLLAWPRPAAAIPVFARKYGTNCTMCHSSYPRLNDYGVRYRQNGYQLPGREEEEQTVLESPAPFAVRAVAGYRQDTFRHTPDGLEVKHFQLASADLLSGGLLAPDLGYIFVYPPRLTGSASVVAQPGDVEMANAVFSRLGGDNSLRAGRMEPAYLAFSDKRRLSLSPYEVYDFTFPGGVALADTMDGVEAAHFGPHATDFYAGWVSGSSANQLNDTPADVYLRASTVLGAGEGQTVGQRLGVMGYFGRSRPAEVFPAAGRKSFHRLGADASLNFSQWNVGLQYLQGHDSGELWGRTSDVTWSGGFVETLYQPATNLVGFARYGWVNTPSSLHEGTRRWTFGGRYYLADNVALHLEASHRRQEAPLPGAGKPTEHFYTAAVDFGF